MALPSANHIRHCILLFALIVYVEITSFRYLPPLPPDFDPWTTYGYFLTTLLYFFRINILLHLPHTLFSFAGLVLYDAFPKRVALTGSLASAPFVCFRVVTRGDCPRLVRENVSRNLATCAAVRIDNFCFEVVTERRVDLAPHHRVREIVVPPGYRTANGSLFKARNLQYCLEDDVNQLEDKDYVVHLDEDSVLTANAVRGIGNFVMEGKHACGAGLVVYNKEGVTNWLGTCADFLKIGEFMGRSRFQFLAFNKPLFGWKSSFMVIQVSAERAITFDFGPDGSLSEGNFFCMKAFELGYSFTLVEGEIWERSAPTFLGVIRQRKRWMQGSLLLARSDDIPLSYKSAMMTMIYSWAAMPLIIIGALLNERLAVPLWPVVNLVFYFIIAVNVYLVIFGAITSYTLKRCGVVKYLCMIVGTVISVQFVFLIMAVASLWGLVGNKHQFYVVRKESDEEPVIV